MARKTDPASPASSRSGLVVGGLGGPEDELLESGQEEVFSRSEVERGQIEHHVEAGSAGVERHDDKPDPGEPPPHDPEA